MMTPFLIFNFPTLISKKSQKISATFYIKFNYNKTMAELLDINNKESSFCDIWGRMIIFLLCVAVLMVVAMILLIYLPVLVCLDTIKS